MDMLKLFDNNPCMVLPNFLAAATDVQVRYGQRNDPGHFDYGAATGVVVVLWLLRLGFSESFGGYLRFGQGVYSNDWRQIIDAECVGDDRLHYGHLPESSVNLRGAVQCCSHVVVVWVCI